MNVNKTFLETFLSPVHWEVLQAEEQEQEQEVKEE